VVNAGAEVDDLSGSNAGLVAGIVVAVVVVVAVVIVVVVVVLQKKNNSGHHHPAGRHVMVSQMEEQAHGYTPPSAALSERHVQGGRPHRRDAYRMDGDTGASEVLTGDDDDGDDDDDDDMSM
jgi:hypothetical protein